MYWWTRSLHLPTKVNKTYSIRLLARYKCYCECQQFTWELSSLICHYFYLTVKNWKIYPNPPPWCLFRAKYFVKNAMYWTFKHWMKYKIHFTNAKHFPITTLAFLHLVEVVLKLMMGSCMFLVLGSVTGRWGWVGTY